MEKAAKKALFLKKKSINGAAPLCSIYGTWFSSEISIIHNGIQHFPLTMYSWHCTSKFNILIQLYIAIKKIISLKSILLVWFIKKHVFGVIVVKMHCVFNLVVFVHVLGFPDSHETGDHASSQGLGLGRCGAGQRHHPNDEGGHPHSPQWRCVYRQERTPVQSTIHSWCSV